MAVRIQLRRDTATNWTTNDPILAEGELGLEIDNGRWKVGNGTDAWDALPYSNSIFSGPSSIADSSSGNALRITQTGTGNALDVEGKSSFSEQITSTVATGEAPLVVASTTAVTNLNADLLDGQQGSFYQNAGNLSSGTVLAARLPALTGDVTTTAGNISTTLANSGVTAGTYNNSASQVRPFTVDVKGRLTSIGTAVNIAIAQSAVTNLITDLADKVTKAGVETFTNKTMSGSNNTFTDIPVSAISGLDSALTSYALRYIASNARTSSYTLVLSDDGKLVEMGVGSANTLTVPLNSSVSFPLGTTIVVAQTGSGQTTIVGTGGVTINGTPGLKLRTQWSSATLIKRGTDTWLAMGDLIA